MFAGRYDHALDNKGRTMMPKRFRNRLAELRDSKVWLTKAFSKDESYLDVLPNSTFQSLQERMSAVRSTPGLKAFIRLYIGAAIEVEIDAAGRMLIPAPLRQALDLGDKVAFVGTRNDRFELWHPAELEEQEAAIAENFDAIMADLQEAGVDV